jgi:hypothetical protein
MAQNLMLGRCRAMGSSRFDQLPAAQSGKCRLDRALGKTGAFGDRAKAGRNISPSGSLSLAIEIKIDQECGRLLVVTDKIGHQNIEHIIIDRNRFMKSRHGRNNTTISLNGQ